MKSITMRYNARNSQNKPLNYSDDKIPIETVRMDFRGIVLRVLSC